MRELSGYSSVEDRRLEKITMSYSHFWVDFVTLMTMIQSGGGNPFVPFRHDTMEKTTNPTQ